MRDPYEVVSISYTVIFIFSYITSLSENKFRLDDLIYILELDG